MGREQILSRIEGFTDLKAFCLAAQKAHPPPAAQLPLSLAANLMGPLDRLLDSPPGVYVAPTQPVSAPPRGRLLDELLDSPLLAVASSLPHGADHCEQAGAHRDRSPVSKKLCLDGAAARKFPPELPLELVCLILSFLFVDDIGNHNSAIGAVSRAWRGATELLAEAWNQGDPHLTPMLVSPFLVMWTIGRRMRTVLKGTWSCTFPCATVLPRHHIGRLLDPLGWLLDDTIVLFFCYVLHIPFLRTTIREGKSFQLRGQLDEWRCPQGVLIEPYIIESFRARRRMNDAADLFCKDPAFGGVLARILLAACTVYVPICVGGGHWILVVLWLRTGVVEVYDSMGGSHSGAAQLVIGLLDRMCLRHEHNTILNTLGIAGWDVIQYGQTSPQQEDSAACGVFVCVTGTCISLGRPVAFSQREVMHWRLRIAFSLATNSAAVTTTPPRTVPVREDPDGAIVILSDSEDE